MHTATCPRCGRTLSPWPLERGDRCSPKGWVNCIRNDDEALALAVEAALRAEGATT